MTWPQPPEPGAFVPDPQAPDARGSVSRWVRYAPAERGTLPAAGLLLFAAVVMHGARIQLSWVLLGGVAVAGLAYGRLSRASRKRRHAKRGYKRDHAKDAAVFILAVTAWLAAATRLGVLAGPHHALFWTWAVGTVAGYWWLCRHEAVAWARRWRKRKLQFLREAHALGVRGAHLVEHEITRLGERLELDTKYTGRRASAIARSDLAERIAEQRDLPPSRVQVKAGRTAGRLVVSIRDTDPWANPIPHPVLDPAPEITLPVPCRISVPLTVGQDPDTGTPLTLPLLDPETGAKNVSVVGLKGSGKTVLLHCISERVTAAEDALLIKINLSIKGPAEAGLWGPACHLTAFGPKQATRAVQILRIVCKIIEWRSMQPRTTADFAPSPGNPLIELMIDEIDAATRIQAIRELLETITSKGREFGVGLTRAGQRGTADWTGGANIRANDDVFCLGMVNRAGEAVHAAGDLGLEMPNMASYGEGHAGVWAVAELGGDVRTGRTFNLKNPADVRQLACERAHRQPGLSPALAEFLGDKYAALLASDLYATWAATGEGRRHRAGTPSSPVTIRHEDVTEGEGGVMADTEPDPDGPPPARGDDHDDRPALAALDFQPDLSSLPEHLQDRARELFETNRETRRVLAQSPPPTAPGERTQEQAAAEAALTRARWREQADATDLPDDARQALMRLLAGEGTSVRRAAEALGVSKRTAHEWLIKLLVEGAARLTGKGPATRWMLTDSDDAGEGDA